MNKKIFVFTFIITLIAIISICLLYADLFSLDKFGANVSVFKLLISLNSIKLKKLISLN